MSLISGIRLHTALSIMLVSTLIFAQFASTSVLELADDAAPSGENDDIRENDATERLGMDFAAGGDAVAANGMHADRLFDSASALDSDECGDAVDSRPPAPISTDVQRANVEGRQANDVDWDEDIIWWEPVPEVHLEFLDNGNILVTHELDGEVWWDYINFAEDGSITVISIDAWGTHVISPAPRSHADHSDRDRGETDRADYDWYVESGNGPRMDSAAGIPFDDPCGGDDAPTPVKVDWISVVHDAAPQRTAA